MKLELPSHRHLLLLSLIPDLLMQLADPVERLYRHVPVALFVSIGTYHATSLGHHSLRLLSLLRCLQVFAAALFPVNGPDGLSVLILHVELSARVFDGDAIAFLHEVD